MNSHDNFSHVNALLHRFNSSSCLFVPTCLLKLIHVICCWILKDKQICTYAFFLLNYVTPRRPAEASGVIISSTKEVVFLIQVCWFVWKQHHVKPS